MNIDSGLNVNLYNSLIIPLGKIIQFGSAGYMYGDGNTQIVIVTNNQLTAIFDSTHTITGQNQVRAAAAAPLGASDLTRKDYVDARVAVLQNQVDALESALLSVQAQVAALLP
jgi:hypothetical protein